MESNSTDNIVKEQVDYSGIYFQIELVISYMIGGIN